MNTLRKIDRWGRRVVAYPLGAIGYGLTIVAHALILTAAALLDVEVR